jgi:hypothetical protein
LSVETSNPSKLLSSSAGMPASVACGRVDFQRQTA